MPEAQSALQKTASSIIIDKSDFCNITMLHTHPYIPTPTKRAHITSSISRSHTQTDIISLVASLKGVRLLKCVGDRKFSAPFPLVSRKKKNLHNKSLMNKRTPTCSLARPEASRRIRLKKTCSHQLWFTQGAPVLLQLSPGILDYTEGVGEKKKNTGNMRKVHASHCNSG